MAGLARSRSATSSARRRGRIRSSTTTAGRRRTADSTASTPSVTSWTRKAEVLGHLADVAPRARVRSRHDHQGRARLGGGAEEGQGEAEGRALARRAAHVEPATVGPNDTVADVEPEAGALDVRERPVVAPARRGGRGAPGPRAAIPIPRSVTLTTAVSRSRRTARSDLSPARGVLDGVREEVLDHLRDPLPVGPAGQGLVGEVQHEGVRGSDGNSAATSRRRAARSTRRKSNANCPVSSRVVFSVWSTRAAMWVADRMMDCARARPLLERRIRPGLQQLRVPQDRPRGGRGSRGPRR